MRLPLRAVLHGIVSVTSLAWVAGAQQPPLKVVSTLMTMAVPENGQPASQVTSSSVYTASVNFEAPNWSKDGASLIFDQSGTVYRIPAVGGTPTPVAMGEGMHCNGSHGLSPDGTLLAVSCETPSLPGSHIYVLPAQGGAPRLVTEHDASYFHTWSPDGRTIVFVRPDHGVLNLVAVDVHSGQEKPLTNSTSGISDDPDFSPDGHLIYFCSDRGGSMQLWRMHADGTSPEQITSDERANWTPHPSPDGRWIVFISYAPGTKGHLANQPVTLRLLSVKDKKIETLVHLVGGAGTINVPSWAPDSRHLAYVGYQVEP